MREKERRKGRSPLEHLSQGNREERGKDHGPEVQAVPREQQPTLSVSGDLCPHSDLAREEKCSLTNAGFPLIQGSHSPLWGKRE